MKIKIGVFFGGKSVEHEVSVISALQAIHAMDKEKYWPVPVYITKEGIMYTGQPLLEIDNYKDIKQLLSKCDQILIFNDGFQKSLVKQQSGLLGGKKIIDTIDVAFPIVHGTNVEDGTIQGYFELLDLPYVGSDVHGSALGMDKITMKRLLKEAEMPIVEYVWFYTQKWMTAGATVVEEIEGKLGYPVIVKPANSGSSVGIQMAEDREELDEAINLASNFSNRIIVERAVKALKEINCSVLGDYEGVEASVCEEPISSSEILSYQDKYMQKGGGSKGMSGTLRKLPAELSDETAETIQKLAKETFITLGCSGVARVDFLIDKAEDKIYVNEINTIPGSLSFYLWEASGKPFKQLLNDLIQLALKRGREKRQLTYTYDSNILAQKNLMGVKK